MSRVRRLLAIALVLVVAGGGGTAVVAQETPPELVLKRVMLSTGGVGYFEYEASVTDDATLTLDVRLDQVDDVLKSIVVYDDSGAVGGISLPGRAPLDEVFRELPFDRAALDSPDALLKALQGAEVRTLGGRQVRGRIIGVEVQEVQLPADTGTTLQHRVSVMTDDGIRQFLLEQADAIQFADPALQEQIGRALAAMGAYGAREGRRLTVLSSGAGARVVRVGYLVETPLWKASYRLTVPAGDGDGPAELRGWAVVENLSGEDWRDVELTIVSGNPVTFRQALYESYFVERPEVPVEVLGRILPDVDTGAMPLQTMADSAMPRARGTFEKDEGFAGAESLAMAPSPMGAAGVDAAGAQSTVGQVTFRLPRPVTLSNGHSALVPIVDRAVSVDRVSLYQPQADPTHPLLSLRLDNDGGQALPPGVITLYARDAAIGVTHVGDARLGALPAGEGRLLSFAVDHAVRIDRNDRTTRTVTRARLVDGLLELSMRERQTTLYTIAGAADEDRRVLLEHPRLPGWDLATPSEGDVEITPAAYRVGATVPAGETVTVETVLERPVLETVELVTLNADQILFYAGSAELDPALRQGLELVAERRSAVGQQRRSLAAVEQERGAVLAEQERLRASLQAVPEDSDLFRRYLAQLAAEEDTLDALGDRIAEARAAVREAEDALRAAARDLPLTP